MSAHVLVGVFELIFKVVVEAVEQVGPLLLALFNIVEFFFKLRRVLGVEDVRKALDQQIAHHHADFGGIEASARTAVLDHVFAILNRVDDRSVR